VRPPAYAYPTRSRHRGPEASTGYPVVSATCQLEGDIINPLQGASGSFLGFISLLPDSASLISRYSYPAMATIQGLHSMDGLRTAEQIQLLDLVDSLRAEGLSEFTALPQLIVCGDQSSGKSSLLEAISGVPFPKKDNLCTRFATEVILRRALDSEIRVSLVRSPNL
jgi:hypothetical protein